MTFHDISHLYNLYPLFCLGHDHWFLYIPAVFPMSHHAFHGQHHTPPPMTSTSISVCSTAALILPWRIMGIGTGLFGSRHLVNGHATGSDLLEVPTMYKVYLLGLWFRGCTRKIWPNIWYSTSILGSWNSHWLGYINSGILTLGTNCI